MPTYEVQHGGQTYEVQADSPEHAANAFGGAAPASGDPQIPEPDFSPYVAPSLPAGRMSMGENGEIYDTTPPELEKAAKNGVDIDTGAPSGVAKASFSTDDINAQRVYQDSLTKSLGYEPALRIGPDSKQIEYFNKSTHRWTTTQGTGLTNKVAGSAAGLIKGVPTAVGGVLGAVGGGALGGPAGAGFGSIGGSAAGAAAGQAAANYIGNIIGANPGDETPVGKDVGEAAVTAGGWDAASMAGLGLFRYGKYVIRGKQPFTSDEARSLLNEQKRQSGIVREISQGSGMSFRPTAAQIATAPNSGILSTQAAAQAAAHQLYAESAESTRVEFATLQTRNEQAIQNYFENKINQFRQQGLNNDAAAKEVAQGLTDPYNAAKTLAQQEIAKLPANVPEAQTAEITRGAMLAARSNFEKTVERPAWDAYRTATGYDPLTASSHISMPWSQDVRDLMQSWSAEQKNALLDIAKQDTGGLKLNMADEPTDDDVALFKSLGSEPPKQGVDLASVDNAIRWLRKNARTRMANQQGVVLDTKKLNDLEGALSDMRDNWLDQNRPDIKGLLDTAEAASTRKAQTFRNGLVDTMLVHDSTGQLRLTDGEALNRLMSSNDEGQINQVLDLVKADPAAKDQLNQYLLAKYRAEVTNDKGVPVPSKHAQFMKNYGVFINNAFDPSQVAQINKIGGMAQVVKNEYLNLKSLVPKKADGSDGSIQSLNSNKLVTGLLSGSQSTETLDKALKTINKYPYADFAKEQWRASAADAIYNQLVKNGKFDPNALTSLIQGNNGQQLDVIEKLFNTAGKGAGTKLKIALKNLQQGQSLIETPSFSGTNPTQMNLFQKSARAVVGPFSEEGRMLTLLKQFRGVYNPAKIYRALTDPNELNRYVIQSSKTIKQIKGVSAVVGAGLATEDMNAK